MKADYLCPKTCPETPNLDNLNINAIFFNKNAEKLDILACQKVFPK
jgi:hypothetical protein